MSSTHFNVGIVSFSGGTSAVQSSAYVWKEREKDSLRGQKYDYSIKENEVCHREFLSPDNAKDLFEKPEDLWNNIELREASNLNLNAQLARKGSLGLHRELTREQNIKLAHEFFDKLRQDGMFVQWAFHDQSGNPHADFMLSMRRWDSSKNDWAPKKKTIYLRDENGHLIPAKKTKTGKQKYKYKTINNAWDDPKLVEQWRSKWQEMSNKALLEAGSDVRIDMRSYERQRIDAIAKGDTKAAERLAQIKPGKHYGPRGKRGLNHRLKAQAQAKKDAYSKVVKSKKRANYWRKKAKESSADWKQKYVKKYGCPNNVTACSMFKHAEQAGLSVRQFDEYPRGFWSFPEAQRDEIDGALKSMGFKSADARKWAYKNCAFGFDKLNKEWCMIDKPTQDAGAMVAKGVIKGVTKGVKVALTVIGGILTLGSRLPLVKAVPGASKIGSLSVKAGKKLDFKMSKVLANDSPHKKPTELRDESKLETAMKAKDGLSAGQSQQPPQPQFHQQNGIKSLLKECLADVKGGLNPTFKDTNGMEFNFSMMSPSAIEQYKIDHGISLDDEWEVQGFSKSRMINPNASFRTFS